MSTSLAVSNVLAIMLISLINCSCDIVGDIKVKNGTDEAIVVKIIHKKEPSLPEDKEIRVAPGDAGYMYYGFGTVWTDEYIMKYSQKIDTVIINRSNGDIVLTQTEYIQEWFEGGRRDLLRKRLVIVVDSFNSSSTRP